VVDSAANTPTVRSSNVSDAAKTAPTVPTSNSSAYGATARDASRLTATRTAAIASETAADDAQTRSRAWIRASVRNIAAALIACSR
jgi:hypothetical protein